MCHGNMMTMTKATNKRTKDRLILSSERTLQDTQHYNDQTKDF